MAAVAVSCTDYLDKAPGSDIDENTPYQNFRNFQGFVEELYGALPLYSASTWHSCWNYGEDEHMKDNGNSVRFLTLAIDNGNYRCMVDENMNDAGDQNFYGAPAGVFSADMASGTRERKKNLWQLHSVVGTRRTVNGGYGNGILCRHSRRIGRKCVNDNLCV